MHRRKRDEGVIDAVVRENDDWPLDRELAIEQRLRDRADAAQHLGVSDAPPTLPGALGEKDRLRRLNGPMFEHVAEVAAIWLEPLRRAQDHAAVCERGDIDARRGKADVGERRLRHVRSPRYQRILRALWIVLIWPRSAQRHRSSAWMRSPRVTARPHHRPTAPPCRPLRAPARKKARG